MWCFEYLVESVERGSIFFESVDDVLCGHGVSARVFCVCVGCNEYGFEVLAESYSGLVYGG